MKTSVRGPSDHGSQVLGLRLGRSRLADAERPWPDELEVGIREPHWVTMSGMYSLEKFEGKPLRWTAAVSEIRVPLNPRTLPKKMSVALWGIAPPEGMAISISANEVEIFRGHVHGAGLAETLALPSLIGSPVLVIRLKSPGYEYPGDDRRLGVAIKSITLRR